MLTKDIDLKKGSPNRMLLVLGVLLKRGGNMQQKKLALEVGLPVSSIVDLIKKANQVEGNVIVVRAGCYKIDELSPAYSAVGLMELAA